ncbi:uncharacterized protein LOC143036148 [Oratosquilla oratoria]|uniref:uncharacterized protein LOC143036148 n=1 Tax=Oratosquilla oratoria TaxID=337810 RepID=UPI003F768292
MNRKDYINKMLDLLSDTSTYVKKHKGHADQEGEKFKKEARRILTKSVRGKKLVGLLEEAPRPPCMRGLPKTHKPNIPMRPITSGIRSAPHRLAKCLAKPLSVRLGSLSKAHLKNSHDLIERMRNVDLTHKTLVSYDVTSLFTNVSIEGALKAAREVVSNMRDEDLPLVLQIATFDSLHLATLCQCSDNTRRKVGYGLLREIGVCGRGRDVCKKMDSSVSKSAIANKRNFGAIDVARE